MTQPIPRLPVFDWGTFTGSSASATPCLLTHPSVQFTVSGRASILLALEMIKVGPGDKVLMPTYHCTTMIAPVVALGAQSIFYPINSVGGPDLRWIQQHFSKDVRAILVAHFFGLPQSLAEIRHWCDQQGVILIEDCAHALFGLSSERAVGQWGDLAIASLTKFLPVPEGGCLVKNHAYLPRPLLRRTSFKCQLKAGYDIVHAGVIHGRLAGLGMLINGASKLRGIFRAKQAGRPVSQGPPMDAPNDGLGIDVGQAHLELTAASHWIALRAPRARIVDRRRGNYLFFSQMLSEVAGMHPLLPKLPDHCAPYVFPLWVEQPDPGYAELRRLEFPVSRWDRLWPSVTQIDGDVGVNWSHHVLQLACHQDLTTSDLQRMVAILKRIYAGPQPLTQAA
jgi:perosamine synthetase